jgi:hypothetical protein
MLGQPTPIPATMPMTVTLEAQQWNGVMTALSEAPYKIAAPLLEAIQAQLQSSLQSSIPPKLPNGEALAAQPPMSVAVPDAAA